MTMLRDYEKAKEKFARAIAPLNPSESFNSFRRADAKAERAIKAMDQAAGSSAGAMAEAADQFGVLSTPYFSKMEKQCTKENRTIQRLLKQELTKFQRNIFGAIESYRADAEKLAEGEAETPARGAARGQISAGADAAAEAASARKLAQAIKAFNDRRQAHLRASADVLRTVKSVSDKVKRMRAAGAKALAQVETAAASDPGKAEKVSGQLHALSAEAVRLAEGCKRKHTSDLKDKFQKERNMRFGTLQKEFDLEPGHERAFLANQKSQARVFTQATDNGKLALDEISQMRVVAEELEAMSGQAAAVAEGGEALRAFVLSDLTEGRSIGLVRAALEEFDNAVDSMNKRIESVATSIRNLRSNTDPEAADRLLDTALSFGNVLSDATNTAGRKRERLDAAMKGVIGKVPKVMAKDPEVLAAARGMLNAANEIKESHNKLVRESAALDQMIRELT